MAQAPRPGADGAYEALWTIPNLLTFARILLTPAFLAAFLRDQPMLAWLLFLAAGVSDALDGYLAQRLRQRSRLGTIIDPLADKFLLVTAFLCLGAAGELPLWLVLLVVVRDVVIVGGLLVLRGQGVRVEDRIQPSLLGKASTLLQLSLVLLVLTQEAWGADWRLLRLGLAGLTAVVTAASGGLYGLQGRAMLRQAR